MPVIVGATATGKTDLALCLAEMLEGEIVSADSRQVYRYMNIGTAKPADEQLQKVPHHCIDICDPDTYFSAGEFGRTARKAVAEIQSRGRRPVVAGGSGLYIQALVDGIFEGNFRDPGIRQNLKDEAAHKGLDHLYKRLLHIDPLYAATIHPNDLRRIIRALEVYTLSGKTISELQKKETKPAQFQTRFFGLKWPRDVLYQRINDRTDSMMMQGFTEEVEALLKKGYTEKDNAMQSVGYSEIIDYLKNTYNLDETVEHIKQNTRRFAKRQITWFKRDNRIHWFEISDTPDWEKIGRLIMQDIS